MKIEKINENQIRCTLNKEDLESRNIKLTELAYGTGKTRELFQDMMQQANEDFGFEVNDIPLMVEAIPASPESIILVITKVEDPEETENHLAKFFSRQDETHEPDHPDDDFSEVEMSLKDFHDFAENIADKIHGHLSRESDDTSKTCNEDDSVFYSIFKFNNLREIITVSHLIAPFFKGDSSVYKSPLDDKYYLSICMDAGEEADNEQIIRRVCSVLVEHGTKEDPTYVKEIFYMEHFDEIISNQAIESLSNV